MELLYNAYTKTQEKISMLEVEKLNLEDEFKNNLNNKSTNKLKVFSCISLLGVGSFALIKSQPDFIYNVSDTLNNPEPEIALAIVLSSLLVVPAITTISAVKDSISQSNVYNKVLSTINPKKYEQRQTLLELKKLIQNVDDEMSLESKKLANLKEEMFEELPDYIRENQALSNKNNSSVKIYTK